MENQKHEKISERAKKKSQLHATGCRIEVPVIFKGQEALFGSYLKAKSLQPPFC